MNWIDTILLVILGLNVFNGLRRGLIATLFDNISVLAAAAGSWKFGMVGIELFSDSLHLPPVLANVFSYGLTGIAIYCVGALLGAILHKIVRTALPMMYDVVLGGILGLVKGLLFASIIFVPLIYTPSLPIDVYTALQESRIIEWVRPTIDKRIPELQQMLRSYTNTAGPELSQISQ